jgi:hypothetical protein
MNTMIRIQIQITHRKKMNMEGYAKLSLKK